MWSVVHLPAAFSSTRSPVRSLPSHAGNGSSSSSRSRVRASRRPRPSRRVAGRRRGSPTRPGRSPAPGSSSATGGSSLTVGAVGAGDRRRARSRRRAARRAPCATTVSGEPMNASVSALPSLRRGKLRLNEVTIVLRSPMLDVVALPLADARPARVGEHRRADRLEVGEQAVALDRRPHLLRTRRDEQRRAAPAARPPSPGGRRARRGRCPRRTSWCTSRRARTRSRAGSPRSATAAFTSRDRPVEVGRVRADEVRLERRRGRSR